MIDFGIDVIKIITVFLVIRHEWFSDEVEIRTSGGNIERRFPFHNRTSQVDFAS